MASVRLDTFDSAVQKVVGEVEKLGRNGICVKAEVCDSIDAKGMIDACVENLGDIEILVNNAGMSKPAML